MDWFEFPEMEREQLRDLRKGIDEGFRDFTRAYGETIENALYPVEWFLKHFENLLLDTPWIIVLLALSGIVYFASRRPWLTLGTFFGMALIGYFGMWEDAMKTLAMISTATLGSVLLGIPLGIGMAKSDRVQTVMNPILDVMQTMPSFVYLIPVIMLFGIGKLPGIIAVIIYAIPPIIRLTNLGIRLVDKEVLEAADAFGSTSWKRLTNVQIPLALPTIMAGVNQTIMMALAMVVVAALVGAPGLGQPVLKAINNQFLFMGVSAGMAIVILAIIIDRASQAYGQRLQSHREKEH
ncbi:ABC transporter permease [Ahrensia marina]|uniref:ABC transporter permease n=1 Tax=Ahrensia marina TaxID=1514904 RepID=A0A0M9GM84_9HYPH|nr:proline/glycine betaine ABC transporter permease [Ahrensia marina]KPB00779.1 ABC transporter permease [Ahrensia marina]